MEDLNAESIDFLWGWRLILVVNVMIITNNGVLSHYSLPRIRVTFLLILMVLSLAIRHFILHLLFQNVITNVSYDWDKFSI